MGVNQDSPSRQPSQECHYRGYDKGRWRQLVRRPVHGLSIQSMDRGLMTYTLNHPRRERLTRKLVDIRLSLPRHHAANIYEPRYTTGQGRRFSFRHAQTLCGCRTRDRSVPVHQQYHLFAAVQQRLEDFLPDIVCILASLRSPGSCGLELLAYCGVSGVMKTLLEIEVVSWDMPDLRDDYDYWVTMVDSGHILQRSSEDSDAEAQENKIGQWSRKQGPHHSVVLIAELPHIALGTGP